MTLHCYKLGKIEFLQINLLSSFPETQYIVVTYHLNHILLYFQLYKGKFFCYLAMQEYDN